MPRDGAPARARLRAAALALYRDRGYDETTTAEIAARAGVTERTYFRHFADKREVLFDGEAELRAILVDAIAAAPEDMAPLSVLVRAFTATVPLLVQNRRVAAQREAIIAVTPALRERALAKIAALTEAIADALTARGVEPATARLAAQIGIAAFERASRAWADDPTGDLAALIDAAAGEVRSLSAAPAPAQRRVSGASASRL